jgi:peptidoglycan/xylan/chitin deacetylase (PgdA/CDA1 family)
MSFYQKIPGFFQWLFPRFTWKLPNDKREVYLTFDDGPHPLITHWVLDELKLRNQKATFFCVGENAEKFPAVIKAILDQGHSVGNHTYRHMKGWGVNAGDYLEDVEKCDKILGSKIFRPPYGRITRKQLSLIEPKYRIIMWNLLSEDYKKGLNIHATGKLLKQHTKAGSIVVFHDSVKAEANLKALLPDYLQFLEENNFTCSAI